MENYFKAAKIILDGCYVENLEKFRKSYNGTRGFSGYMPESVVISFVADAENRILAGKDPMKVYSGFEGTTPEDFRERGKKVLEIAVNRELGFDSL